MSAAKKVADGITWTRAGIGVGLVWLGWRFGERALAPAAWLMLINWVGDVLDGAVARKSPEKIITWIGEHDIEVDIFVSICLSVFLWRAGFIRFTLLIAYLVLWLLAFLAFGFHRSLGMLFQAPIYLILVVKALTLEPLAGWAIVFGLLLLIWITWPRFPEQVVPGFLGDLWNSLQDFGRRRGA